MTVKKLSLVSGCLAIFVAALCLSCSRYEYPWKGAVPPAPKSPRDAHVIKKQGAGMNAVGSMEDSEQQAQSAWSLKGTATVAPEAQKDLKPGETLFVIVRDLSGNPTPVAAARMLVDQFPVAIELTAKDAMNGEPPAEVQVILRLDDDGDLTTHHPGDLMGGPIRAKAGEAFSVVLAEPEKKP